MNSIHILPIGCFPPFSCINGGNKTWFRLYQIYSKVVPLTFFYKSGSLGHWLTLWVIGSWVTYAMGHDGPLWLRSLGAIPLWVVWQIPSSSSCEIFFSQTECTVYISYKPSYEQLLTRRVGYCRGETISTSILGLVAFDCAPSKEIGKWTHSVFPSIPNFNVSSSFALSILCSATFLAIITSSF